MNWTFKSISFHICMFDINVFSRNNWKISLENVLKKEIRKFLRSSKEINFPWEFCDLVNKKASKRCKFVMMKFLKYSNHHKILKWNLNWIKKDIWRVKISHSITLSNFFSKNLPFKKVYTYLRSFYLHTTIYRGDLTFKMDQIIKVYIEQKVYFPNFSS